jgi:stress-induced-phosphoprotein 1
MPNAKAEALKAEGNTFFKSGQYAAAISKYAAASEVDPTVPAYHSNAAACWEKLSNFKEMEKSARACISADKGFVKGYFRLATALKNLEDMSACIKALESGLAVQSSNPDLKKMKKEVTEIQRNEQVSKFCNKAEEQMQGGDIAGAYKTLELASRLDSDNPQIRSLMSRVKPKFEQMEAKRKSGLSTDERHKERGDEAYKAANFEGAIVHYTACIDSLRAAGKTDSELAIKTFSNRAACYKQISNFDGTIEDCTAVLEVDPENVKALIRRAQAFEGVERYRFSLQDCRTVLSLPYEKVGKTNYDLCNMMQHRLNRTVAQLKKM